MKPPLDLPSHCGSCGAYLMGGATKHQPGCEIQRLIDAVLGAYEKACGSRVRRLPRPVETETIQ